METAILSKSDLKPKNQKKIRTYNWVQKTLGWTFMIIILTIEIGALACVGWLLWTFFNGLIQS